MINKKSQAALEFIMTYGWAILVVLVAIGALAYFGVLSPDRFLPSKCNLQAGIACIDHKATPAQVQVRLVNSLGFDIDTITVKAGSCGTSSSPATLANGAQSTYTITCSPVLTGSKYNQQLNISYTVTETSITHNNVGQITTRIE
ncbi:hypothetical protein CMO83_00535 [Candidatus Woesearchaeota archaeon]|jgi:hypothetical protein|nr:hypothetical protein [Candidatus Woesearchaeota archaeon]|tara:strand:- start:564 stop:998 length:435 start_codon:yes stop_codon:yes gene_type:complete